jgi:predicted RNA-binding protein Jag
MEKWENHIREIFKLMGFSDLRTESDPEARRVSVFIYENPRLIEDNLLQILDSINYLMQLYARKEKEDSIYIDLNNYRKERERLIVELARTAARKVQSTGQALSLPAMNSYERRLIHAELTTHPGVKTESEGLGKDRFVVIKPLAQE